MDLINLTGAVPAPLDRAGIVSRSLCLRESCMRENCTYSLSGGRWPARKRATSDPTPRNLGKTEGREGPLLPSLVHCGKGQPDCPREGRLNPGPIEPSAKRPRD